MNELTTKTDREIMVMLAEMEAAQINLKQQIQAVQNEWMRRVQEEKNKPVTMKEHFTDLKALGEQVEKESHSVKQVNAI